MSTLTIPATRPRRPRSAATARPAPTARATAPVRLTRRGRLVMWAAVLGAAFGMVGVAQPSAFALGRGDAALSQRVTVRPGETLWAIAQRSAPGADPRETVARIQSMNDLDTSAVPAGSILLLPASG